MASGSQIGLRSLLALLRRASASAAVGQPCTELLRIPPAPRKLKKPKAPIENPQVKRRVNVGVVLLPANRWLREREVGERARLRVCLQVSRSRTCAHAHAHARVSETLLSSSSRISLRLNCCRAGAFMAVLEICIHLCFGSSLESSNSSESIVAAAACVAPERRPAAGTPVLPSFRALLCAPEVR